MKIWLLVTHVKFVWRQEYISPEEYLEGEKVSAYKNEYIDYPDVMVTCDARDRDEYGSFVHSVLNFN